MIKCNRCLAFAFTALLAGQLTTSAVAAQETKAYAYSRVHTHGGQLGVGAGFYANIQHPQPGHRYELRYQIRMHQRKGAVGPLIQTKQMPNGAAWRIARSKTAGRISRGVTLAATVDITRRDLLNVTNFPKQRFARVVLRLEPHVFDLTAKKFLTPPKTEAIILVADIANGRIQKLQLVGEWLYAHRNYGDNLAVNLFKSLDACSFYDNGLIKTCEEILSEDGAWDDTQAAFLNAMPMEMFKTKSQLGNPGYVDSLRKHAGPKLKAAIERKLAILKSAK